MSGRKENSIDLFSPLVDEREQHAHFSAEIYHEYRKTVFVFVEAFRSVLPVRCGLGFGELVHTENHERPGTVITLYGAGYNDAAGDTEPSRQKG